VSSRGNLDGCASWEPWRVSVGSSFPQVKERLVEDCTGQRTFEGGEERMKKLYAH